MLLSKQKGLSGFLLMLLLLAGLNAPSFGMADFSAEPKPHNLKDIDFMVPWGFRFGQPSRNFFALQIGQDGKVEEIETLKSTPHDNYVDVALMTLRKYEYPASAAGQTVYETLDYCVLTDGQSTFACKIRFERLSVDPGEVAQKPGDRAYYKIDRFSGYPRVKKARLPEFPRQAALKNICGQVELELTVNKKGKARNIKVVDAHPGGLFNLTTVEALKKFEFEPVEEPLKVQYRVTFEVPGQCGAKS